MSNHKIESARESVEEATDEIECAASNLRASVEDLVEVMDNAMSELTDKMEQYENIDAKLVFDPRKPDFDVLQSMLKAAMDMAKLLSESHNKLVDDHRELRQKNMSLIEDVRLLSNRNAELEAENG